MNYLSPIDQLLEAIALVRVAADSAAASERSEIHMVLGVADERLQEVINTLEKQSGGGEVHG